jgi:hypothetical protein
MKQILTSALYLIMIFSLSHFVFEPSNLYFELKWLDIPMHIMGGFGVAALVAAVLSYYDNSVTFWKLLLAYTLAAIAWEVYDHLQGFVDYSTVSGWLDTVKDYVDGLIGASLAYLFIHNK